MGRFHILKPHFCLEIVVLAVFLVPYYLNGNASFHAMKVRQVSRTGDIVTFETYQASSIAGIKKIVQFSASTHFDPGFAPGGEGFQSGERRFAADGSVSVTAGHLRALVLKHVTRWNQTVRLVLVGGHSQKRAVAEVVHADVGIYKSAKGGFEKA